MITKNLKRPKAFHLKMLRVDLIKITLITFKLLVKNNVISAVLERPQKQFSYLY